MKFKRSVSVLLSCSLFYCCSSDTNKPDLENSQEMVLKRDSDRISASREIGFEERNYLKIDKILSGDLFTDQAGKDVFYRVLQIAEEESLTLFAEAISIGEEGGSYKLINRIRLTDDASALPKFGLYSVDSLRFTDSVTIEGLFNAKKMKIKLTGLK